MGRWLDRDGKSRFWPEEEIASPAPDARPGPLVSRLDPGQRKAATAVEPQVLLVAVAGSGKTTTLTARVEHLVATGTGPDAIWVLTFTRKAARELGERLGDHGPLLGACGTFHSVLLHEVVRRYPHVVGLRRPRVIEESQAFSRLRWAAIELNRTERLDLPETMAGLLPIWRDDLDVSRRRGTPPADKKVALLLDAYLKHLAERDEVDFAGIIGHSLTILQENDGARLQTCKAISHVLVDEFQDTDHQQLELVKLLVSEGAHLYVVGDADQSIYYWRGAAPDNLARLKEDFPGLAVYPLGVTYRCPPAVANLANQLISRNAEAFHGARARLGCPPGQWAGKGAPGVTVKHCPDKEAAAGWVVGSIAELLAGGEEPGSVAVLYRSRRSKGSLPEQLRHAGLPFVVAGEKSLSCRATTRELFAFADACLDPVKNDGALLEVAEDLTGPLKLGLGPRRRQDAIDEAVAKGLALAEVLLGNGARTEGVPGGTRLMDLVAEGHDRIADGPHKFFAWARLALLVDERLEKADKAPNDVNELLAAAEKATFDGLSVVEFMERLALDDEVGNNPGGAATLSTVHAAKGLEWPHVFVVGLDKNVWPDRRSPQGEELAEERRLLHVAITRTKWHLYVAGTTDWTASPWLFEVAREARSWDGREG